MSNTKTILIVDDSESDRLLCRYYIESDPDNSYHVLEAETINQGLELWRSQHPDVVLIDLNLTDGNGLVLLETIREQSQTNNSKVNSKAILDPKLPVIILTGSENVRDAVSAIKLGAFDYLVKNDITKFSLQHSIRSLLSSLALSQQLEMTRRREELVSQIALNIRQFLNLEDICQTVVQEICQFIKVDRAVIYKFSEDMRRRIITEAVVPPWRSCLNFMSGLQCLHPSEQQINNYLEGTIYANSDIYKAGFSECHVQMLEDFQVKANVVLPILLSEPLRNNLKSSDQPNNHSSNHSSNQALWGLLIVHQCSATRNWEDCEIKLLQQLSVQLAIAIQQTEIHQNLQNLNTSLAQQVQERTSELQDSEHKLRSILNAIPDVINLISIDGIYLESKRSKTFHDLIPKHINPVGKSLIELVSSEKIATNQIQAIQRAIATEEIQVIEQNYQAANTLHYEEVRVFPFSDNAAVVIVRDISDRRRAEEKLKLQYRQTQILVEVTLKIRQSLQIEEILKTTVTEIQRIFQVNRVLIVKLNYDGSGEVLQETITAPFKSVGKHIAQPCFHDEYSENYYRDRFIKIDNIDADHVPANHAEFFRQFDIKATILTPIIESGNLWGLLVIDQCDRPRQWTDFEVELIQQLSIQLAIALTQNQLIEALQKSEEQRRLAIDLNHIGCWDFDIATDEVIWNENHFKLLGLEPNVVKSSYTAWRERVHPDDLDWVEDAFQASLNNHINLEMEYRVVYPQGDVHWILTKAQEICDASGRAIRMVGLMIDISDRKQMEISLAKELIRNKMLLTNSFDGIVILDSVGNIVECNSSFATMLGYTPEETTNLGIYDIDVRWSREELMRGIQEFKIGKRAMFETRYRKKDGSFCNVEVSANSVKWDDNMLQFCICRDVTQRKLNEQSLQHRVMREQMLNQFIQTIRSSLDLEIVFDSAASAIANLLDLEQVGIVQYITEQKIWKYVAGFRDRLEVFDSVGLEISDQDNPFAEKLKQKEIVQVNNTDEIADEINQELAQRKFGAWLLVPIIVDEKVWGSLSSRKLQKSSLWEDDEILLAQTIANQLAIAIQQVSLYQQLQLELTEHQQTEIALAHAKELAEAASKAKSEFLANMSHEIRTPMNGVLGMAQLLAATPLREDQKNFVQIILDSGDALLTVINDILDFSKIESGKLQLEQHPFNFEHTMNSVCNLLSKQAFDKNVNLQCHVNSLIPTTVLGDSSRLRQIFINLIGNAIKFTNQGYISITYTRRFVTANIYEFRFAIADTGIGLDRDHIDKLFKPFTQADASINRQFGGTGLGLAICKRLVELMNGTIWVESQGNVGGNPPSDWVIGSSLRSSNDNNQGSTFHFTIILPVIEIDSTSKAVNQFISSPINEKWNHFAQFPIKILVVEDNILNQKIVLLMLQRLGCQADIVNNGNECMETIAEQGESSIYDLIFMDVQMPIMDGLTTTRIIRTTLQNQPWIVAVTADVLPEDYEACFKAGMNDYISKPINIKEIERSLLKYIKENAVLSAFS